MNRLCKHPNQRPAKVDKQWNVCTDCGNPVERVNEIPASIIRNAIRTRAARRRAYDEEVRAWFEEGDGRSPEWVRYGDVPGAVCDGPADAERMINIGGKGYAFPHCIHGMSRWTDYDNICGPCEDGLSVYEEGLSLASWAYSEWQERFEWVMRGSAMRAPIDKEEVVAWFGEPLEKINPNVSGDPRRDILTGGNRDDA